LNSSSLTFQNFSQAITIIVPLGQNSDQFLLAEDKPSRDGDWLDKVNLRKVAFWTIVFLLIVWAMAPWLNRPDEEPLRNISVLAGHPLANHPMCGYENVPSFPMWGYSLLMRLFGSLTAVVVVQSFLGSLATAALMVRLNSLVPQASKLTTALFLSSFPWLSFMAYAYQVPMSAAFAILGLLALEMSLQTSKIGWGLLAGALFGIGQNFRSELLLLPGAILLGVLALRKLESFRNLPIKPLIACISAAFVLQLPWAANCYNRTGRFSLSESNLGHVAFLSLGSLPRNPWNITPSDAFAQETVKKAGLECSSLSFQGSDFLKREFFANVKQNPVAYAMSVAHRFWHTIYLPFGYIKMASTSAEEKKAREFARQKQADESSKAAAQAEQTEDVSKVKVAGVLAYSLLQHLLINAVSLLGIVGFFLAMRNGPFQMSQPLILCLSIAILYRCGLNVALSAGGKYMISVYLCYLPFAANSLWQVSRIRFGSRQSTR
jgi:hypothetical protein